MRRTGRYVFTSESVTEGHPDKIADQVSDAVLDAVLAQDPTGRVACETLVTTGLVVLAGEVTTTCTSDFAGVARQAVSDVGYTRAKYGFDAETCAVVSSLHGQSPDIALGVDPGGAGDQGLMFGYACSETPELMPLPIMLSHHLVRALSEVRRSGTIDYLRPDGKSQVTVEYDGDTPVRIDAVVVSSQHSDADAIERIREDVTNLVIRRVIPDNLIDADTHIYVNPTGRFVTGGPHGDSGVTGRKIIVDTYGGMAPHGGGAFSGKDPTKVDRSASYMARYIAKNCVAAGLADRVQLQLAYAIGVADPVSVLVETFGTGKLAEERISGLVRDHFALTPRNIIDSLDLRRPIYRQTAAFGHFGRTEPEFTWERTDKAEALRAAAGL
ncbi:MAG: methionine adenosyltransferase [Acidobacteriota bacterium]|nr:methionine adenosyltransferase [Acidobacteriota bacterium]